MTPIGLELWTRKPVQRCKWGLTDRSVKTVLLRAMWVMEAQLKRLQRGMVLATGLETLFVIIFSKNEVAFCLCPENLPGAKLKSTGLVSLSEFSRQTNLDCSMVIISHYRPAQAVSLGLVYNEKEQAGQKEKTKCTV